MKGRFFRFLTVTLLLFIGVSLSLIVGSLYGILKTTMTQEYVNHIRFRQAEVTRVIQNRLKELEIRVQKMSLDNAVRVNLMLGVKTRVLELISQQYLSSSGAFFFIHDAENKAFLPELPEKFNLLKPYLEDFAREDGVKAVRFRNFGDGVFYSIFSVPVKKQTERLGTAYVIYNISQDTNFWDSFKTVPEAGLLIRNGNDIITLHDGKKVELSDIKWIQRFSEMSEDPMTDAVSGESILPIKEFPGLFYAASSAPLHDRIRSFISKFTAACVIIFILTLMVTLLIARKVSQPLESMAKQALNISEDTSADLLIEDHTGHEEFRTLAFAFNQVLKSLRSSQEELKKKSRQELEASEERYRFTEDAVRKTEARNQAILKAIPDWMLVCDRNGMFLDYHSIDVGDLHLFPDVFIGRNLSDIFPKELAEQFMDSINKAFKSGEIQNLEYQLLKNNTPRYYEARMVVSDIDDVLIIVRDISGRKAADAAFRESQRFNERIMNTTPDIVYIYDIIEYKFIYINRRIADFTGYEPDEIISMGAGFDELFYPDNLLERKEREKQWHNAGDEDIFTNEYKIRAKNGEWRWFHTRHTIFQKNSQNKVSQIIGTARDITERKYMEEELFLAKEAAESANRAKSEFLARMSHEIRTPMNAIMGMNHLAMQTELNTEQKNYLIKIQDAANALMGIINDILDFSKIEAGRLTIQAASFNLENLLDNLSDMLRVKAKEKGIQFLVLTAEDVPFLLIGDSQRLKQVLINLTDNAFKFTEMGEVIITVEVLSKKLDQVELLFSVRDTGIGIPLEKLSGLFDPFTQADGSSTRKFGGTGLGLAICKRITEMMGGRIWADSFPGKGSIFKFTAEFGIQLEEKCILSLEHKESVNPGQAARVEDIQALEILPLPDKKNSHELLSISELLKRLKILLKEGDSEAAECMENIKKCLNGSGPAELIAKIENQINDFDFDDARRSLAELEKLL